MIIINKKIKSKKAMSKKEFRENVSMIIEVLSLLVTLVGWFI